MEAKGDLGLANIVMKDVEDRLTKLGAKGQRIKKKIWKISDNDTRKILFRLNSIRNDLVYKKKEKFEEFTSEKDFLDMHAAAVQRLASSSLKNYDRR
jgi:hypothetical protein